MHNLDTKLRPQLALCLLMLRIGVAIVFFMWTIDKFINPEHAAAVFKKFYMISSFSSAISYAVGGVQIIIVIGFAIGFLKNITYSIILAMHTVSTVSSYKQYFDPWTYPHLLFFAAFPMLAACITLWILRRYDDYSVDSIRNNPIGQEVTT